MRTVHGTWMLARVTDTGDIEAWFTDGGIARARFNDEPFDPTDFMQYDKPVYAALAPVRRRAADPAWLKTVDQYTRFVIRSE